MKAICWEGKQDVREETVPDPRILNPRDAIIRVRLAAICGSDLHLYNGWNPAMKEGDVLGHEFMGEVVETGPEVKSVAVGQRVVVPFNIACGSCFFCTNEMWSLCENSNPNGWMLEKAVGSPTAGLFGYSHLYGGYPGGQAQYVRVPYADVNTFVVPDALSDDQTLFTGDILSTGYMAAENCGIRRGDTVAVWGCGPVGQFAIACASLLGAEQVIAVDRFPDRLEMAEEQGRALVVNYEKTNALEEIKELTGGRGPDACIDAVGMEAHEAGFTGTMDRVKQKLRLETDRPSALRAAVMACRSGGTVSIPGVYTGLIDNFPLGVAFSKGLTFKMGQTHTHRLVRPLLQKIAEGRLDPRAIITHRVSLRDVPRAYKTFNDKEEKCLKVVITP
jgi:threonine dehydrogenase-like Zn-dependent dehydrogenase